MAGILFHVPDSGIGGIDEYTKLMLHMDGENDGTVFTDDSLSPYTVTRYNAVTKIAEKQFGTAAGYFDGSGDYLSVPPSEDFNFGSGDFTIDFWGYFTNRSSDSVIICRGFSGGGGIDRGFRVIVGVTGLGFQAGNQGGDFNLAVNENEWLHIAVVGDSGTIYGYVNGVKGTGSITDSIPTDSHNLLIGGWPLNDENAAGRLFFTGYVDELRISKGIARWTSNFTPEGPYTT